MDAITSGTENFSLKTLGPNGKAPDCRMSSSYHVWTMADQLRTDNAGKARKRMRIYNAVKRFPPTGYSKIALKKLPWQSDVNWGQLAFLIKNMLSSFIDVVTERNRCCEIETDHGDKKDRILHSENISKAFDLAMRSWPGYLPKKEKSVFEMLVYGPGISMYSDRVGWIPESVPNSDMLFPINVECTLDNMEEFVRMRRYTPYQLYCIIKNEKAAEDMGWCKDAVVDAIRYYSGSDYQKMTREQLLRLMNTGGFNWGSCVNQEIPVYEMYWTEFDKDGDGYRISKGVVLQDYTQIIGAAKSFYNNNNLTQEQVIGDHGFLCLRPRLFKKWSDFLLLELESSADVILAEIKSQAEDAFVGSRQYDITMNSLIDAVRVNMMLLIQGGDADATRKLKQMEWLPISILPAGTQALQNRFQVPIGEALTVMQAYMGDLFRGLGQYRINAPTNRGGQRTKGEAELDAAEGAKLTGTQLKSFRESETNWFNKVYERFVKSTEKDDGYEYVEKFWKYLKEHDTPKEAAAYKNIISIRANSLTGAGSPSMKMIVSEKIVGLAGMTAANPGQEAAIRDAIAALDGRDSVDRYRPMPEDQIDNVVRIIGQENAGMTDALVNPNNFPVLPDDRHMEHAVGHRADMEFNIKYGMGIVQGGGADPDKLSQIIQGLTFKGAHIMAHVGYIAKDQTKKDWLKQFMDGMGELEKQTDQLTAIYKKMAEADAPQKQTKEDIEVQTAASLAAIQVDTAKKMADISVGKAATSHAQRTEQRTEQAEQQAATQAAKADIEIEQQKEKNRLENEANIRKQQEANQGTVQSDSAQ